MQIIADTANSSSERPILQNGQVVIRIQPQVPIIKQSYVPQPQQRAQVNTQATQFPNCIQNDTRNHVPVHITPRPQTTVIVHQQQSQPQNQHSQPHQQANQQQVPVRTEIKVLPRPVLGPNSQQSYLCEWNNCKRSFPSAKLVYSHVFDDHINPLSSDTVSSSVLLSATRT